MKELSLNILDIVQNSIRAEAREISIDIIESEADDHYEIIITDNGNGIPEEILINVTDPFVTTRTKRRMGMGLPLLKYHSALAGGNLQISSEPGRGTTVRATMSFSHLDRQPLGDMPGVLIILVAANEDIEFVYHHNTDNGEYRFSTQETKEYLEIDSLSDRKLLDEIRSMIIENLLEIKASGLN